MVTTTQINFGKIMELLNSSSIELAGSDVNHENVGPDRDEQNKRILSASMFPASPH
jgi:hypothetical protein